MSNLKSIIGITVAIIIGLYLIKALDISYPLTIVSTSRSSELSVVGEGKIEATPDTAYVDAGITVNDGKTVGEVQKKIDAVNNKIVDALRGLGVDKKEIKTSNYSIYPNYSYEGRESKITGYNGNVTISIKIKDMAKTSQVVEKVTDAGANQVNGIRYAIDSPEKLREEARDRAIQNAKNQANRLAQKLGIRLGKIINIVESNQDIRPIPIYESGLKIGGAAMEAAPQIEPGTQTITSVVTLYFERK